MSKISFIILLIGVLVVFALTYTNTGMEVVSVKNLWWEVTPNNKPSKWLLTLPTEAPKDGGYILPTEAPKDGGYILTTDGAGTTQWTKPK